MHGIRPQKYGYRIWDLIALYSGTWTLSGDPLAQRPGWLERPQIAASWDPKTVKVTSGTVGDIEAVMVLIFLKQGALQDLH